MIPADWSQAQPKDPILSQILQDIHNKATRKLKLKQDMDIDL